MSIIKGRLGAVYIATGAASTFTDEATTANVAKTVFTITDETKRMWSDDAVVVKYNGTPVTNYASISRPAGIVTWAVSPGSAAVLVSGKYRTVAQLGTVRAWTLEANWDFVDVTCMGDTMRVNMPTFMGSTATVEHFYVDSAVFTQFTAGTPCGLDLFVDSTGGSELRYACTAYISTGQIQAAVDGVVTEPLTFNIIDGPYFVSGLA